MTPEEIVSRAEKAGVVVIHAGRFLFDEPVGRCPTFAEDAAYAERIPPDARYAVVDGMAVARRSDWLPWENHGVRWAFQDDDPYEAETPVLQDELWKLRLGKRTDALR